LHINRMYGQCRQDVNAFQKSEIAAAQRGRILRYPGWVDFERLPQEGRAGSHRRTSAAKLRFCA
jgi:hypothetical protein